MKKNKKNFWFIFFTVAILSFTLLYLGIKYLLGNPVTLQNIAAYVILSLIFGAVSSALYLMQLKIMCSVFALGIFVGYLVMFRTFLGSRSGWEDLTGLLSLFTWMAIGLCAGTALQFLSYFYHKIRYRGKG
ncbi:hypothetical protein [Caproiciproducens sp. CPB-2]|uniref:hypothetical protein n=1 Tax=Caproiciproducens sp. CPB-2 TaxID=3030017 RepID=UPI0023DA1BCB|nr:hypothetical protein [Caproiciproducens sp. CPB-2]MDF1495719.1 hypothetical protein [Caproiciproducens sp. CPB-2]